MMTKPEASTLLAWYDRHRRDLPWRAPPGSFADPYHVWLSEVMLQQTTVAAVIPYFLKFLHLWPDIRALAAAPLDDVLHAWAGLGYYARARNLHKCARVVAEWRDGRFPDEEDLLRDLPGIGDYTAAAIAAIAFGKSAVVMDGNVERVMARIFAVTQPLPAAKPVLKRHAASLTPDRRAGDYAQAVMDLGATICTPRSPSCTICPWAQGCQARLLGIAETLPAKTPKPEKPVRHGVAFWLMREDGAVLLRRRPESGLLGGMIELPSTEWRQIPWQESEAWDFAPHNAPWQTIPGVIRHTFTHFHLDLTLAFAECRAVEAKMLKGIWCPPHAFDDHALPTVMKKLVKHGLKALPIMKAKRYAVDGKRGCGA